MVPPARRRALPGEYAAVYESTVIIPYHSRVKDIWGNNAVKGTGIQRVQ